MKIGASTIAYRDRQLNAELLKEIKGSGVEILELTDYHPAFDYTDLAAFRTLRAALDDLEMQVYTLHAHLLYLDQACVLWASSPDQRQHLFASYQTAIDAFARLGGGIMVTHDIAIAERDQPEHGEQLAALTENLQQITTYAADHNIRIAVENLGRGYFSDPVNLKNLVRAVGLDAIGICIDTGHRNLNGDPVEALRIAGEKLFTVHIHDNHGQHDEHLLPTHGNIQWSSILQTLDDIGYPGVFMYELSRVADIRDVSRNFERLQDK
ncbi:MAG: sugar phosphate isomerase/epimerase family protein [Chloroflexota bacterium]